MKNRLEAQNSHQREKAKAVREQTRHGLMEQKLLGPARRSRFEIRHVNAQSTKQQSQHMLLQKKDFGFN